MSDATINPVAWLEAARAAAEDPALGRMEGLTASPAEILRRALRSADAYVCGCLWCEMLGDRSGRTPPGERVLSGYCAARHVSSLVGDDVAAMVTARVPVRA